MIYWLLFWEFFKTGLFAVGGGMATLPFLRAIAAKYGWYTGEDLLNMLAISEATPGPVGVNMATFAGFTTAGPLGALVATFGLVLPSIIVMILIAQALSRFQNSNAVQDAFYALRPVSAGLVLAAVSQVFFVTLLIPANWAGFASVFACINLPSVILFALMVVAVYKLPRLHPIVFIAAGALIGMLFSL